MSDARTKLRAFAPEFLEVIEGLERRVQTAYACALGSQDISAGLRERLEALESIMRGHSDTLIQHLRRIEALEAERGALTHNQATQVERVRRLEESLIWSAERDRQARWHDTYNAALQSNAVSGVEARHINAVHESCAAAADRAHGPLEAKALSDDEDLQKRSQLFFQPPNAIDPRVGKDIDL